MITYQISHDDKGNIYHLEIRVNGLRIDIERDSFWPVLVWPTGYHNNGLEIRTGGDGVSIANSRTLKIEREQTTNS